MEPETEPTVHSSLKSNMEAEHIDSDGAPRLGDGAKKSTHVYPSKNSLVGAGAHHTQSRSPEVDPSLSNQILGAGDTPTGAGAPVN